MKEREGAVAVENKNALLETRLNEAAQVASTSAAAARDVCGLQLEHVTGGYEGSDEAEVRHIYTPTATLSATYMSR